MKYNCHTLLKLLFIFALPVLNSPVNGQHIRFQKTYSVDSFIAGQTNRDVSFYDLETLSDHGFVTLGFVTDSTNRSEGLISRYDCTGKVIWTKLLGNSITPTNTNAGIVEADNGDIVFSFSLGTGFFRASILCGRITQAGQTVWMKRIGNNTEFGRDIAKTRDGGFIIAGSTGAYGTDNVADDIYLFKLDANGNVLWNKTFGNPGGTYDEAYAVKIDSRDNIIVTGRCIADGTFQAFILKADKDGIPLQFKTYGYTNQRTNAFDLIVDRDDNYLITGFTTILETDHTSSQNDPFLIKVDSAMNTLFTNVYEVSLGDDNSTIGEGLCQLDNGDYAIGVSSLAFSTHNINTPNSPNKNALYIIDALGNLKKAFIYNRHGSQYTRVRKSSYGSVLLSGFSRAYTDKVRSQGLIIKTDNAFLSGCNDIDVTPEVNVYKPSWQIADFNYQTRNGTRVLDYFGDRDSSIKVFTLCDEQPLLTPDFESIDTSCPGKVLFTDLSAGPGERYWIVNGDTIRETGDMEYNFVLPGIHEIKRVLQFSCITEQALKSVFIRDALNDTLRIEICNGKKFNFYGIDYSQEGYYLHQIAGQGFDCDTNFILDLKINPAMTDIEDLGTQYYCDTFSYNAIKLTEEGLHEIILDTLSDCTIRKLKVLLKQNCNCLEFPNIFTPGNSDQVNDDFKPFNACGDSVQIEDFKIEIFNRWGQLVYESPEFKTGWDGRYKGIDAPMDAYIYLSEYKIRYNNLSLHTLSKKGTVTLIR